MTLNGVKTAKQKYSLQSELKKNFIAPSYGWGSSASGTRAMRRQFTFYY